MRKKSFVFVMFAMFLSVLILSNGQSAYANESDYRWAGNPDGTVTIIEYKGANKDVIIPDKLDDKVVTSIGYSTFSNNNLASVTLPASLTSIGNLAFWDNPLMDVTLTSNISSMPDSALSSPRKAGHVFVGWYTDSAFTIEWNGRPADVTLYAKWIVNKYTISFDSQGGSSVPGVVADYATKISAPTEPTKSGHTFVDWFTDTALITPCKEI